MANFIEEYIKTLESEGKSPEEISKLLIEQDDATIQGELKKDPDPAATTATAGSIDPPSSTDLSSETSSSEPPLTELPEVSIPSKFKGFDNEDSGKAELNKLYNEYGYTADVSFKPGIDSVTLTSADGNNIEILGKGSFAEQQESKRKQGEQVQTYEEYLQGINDSIIENQSMDEDSKEFTKKTGVNITDTDLQPSFANDVADDVYSFMHNAIANPYEYGIELGTWGSKSVSAASYAEKQEEFIDAAIEHVKELYPDADTNKLVKDILGRSSTVFNNIFQEKTKQQELYTKGVVAEKQFDQSSIDDYKSYSLGVPKEDVQNLNDALQSFEQGDMAAAMDSYSKLRYNIRKTRGGEAKFAKGDAFWTLEDFDNKAVFPGSMKPSAKQVVYNEYKQYFEAMANKYAAPKKPKVFAYNRVLDDLVKENFIRFNEGNEKTIVIPRTESIQQSRAFFNRLYRDGVIADKNQESVELNFNQIQKYKDEYKLTEDQLKGIDEEKALEFLAYEEYGHEIKYKLNAAKEVIYNNLDPAAIETNSFKSNAGEFISGFASYFGANPELNTDRTKANNYSTFAQYYNNNIEEDELPIFFTSAQQEKLDRTLLNDVSYGVGAFIPLGVELAAAHALTGGAASALALRSANLAKAIGLGKKGQGLFKLGSQMLTEEAVMQAVGFDKGSGASFKLSGTLANKYLGAKGKPFFALKQVYNKVILSGASGAASLEFAGNVETAIKDAEGYADYEKYVDDNYAYLDDVGRRTLVNSLTFALYGGKSLKKTDFSSKKQLNDLLKKAAENGDVDLYKVVQPLLEYRTSEAFDLNTKEGKDAMKEHYTKEFKSLGFDGTLEIKYDQNLDGKQAEYEGINKDGVMTISIDAKTKDLNNEVRHEITHGLFDVMFKDNPKAKEQFFKSIGGAVKDILNNAELNERLGIVSLKEHLESNYKEYKEGTKEYNEEAITTLVSVLGDPVIRSEFSGNILTELKNDLISLGSRHGLGRTNLSNGEQLISFLSRFIENKDTSEFKRIAKQYNDLFLDNGTNSKNKYYNSVINEKNGMGTLSSIEVEKLAAENNADIAKLQGIGTESSGKKSLAQMIVEQDQKGNTSMRDRMLADYGKDIKDAYAEVESGVTKLPEAEQNKIKNGLIERNKAMIRDFSNRFFDPSKGGERSEFEGLLEVEMLSLFNTYKPYPFYFTKEGKTVDTSKYNKKQIKEFLESNPGAVQDLTTPNPVHFGGYAMGILRMRLPKIYDTLTDFETVSLDTMVESGVNLNELVTEAGNSGGPKAEAKQVDRAQIDLVNQFGINIENFTGGEKVTTATEANKLINNESLIQELGLNVVINGKNKPTKTYNNVYDFYFGNGEKNLDLLFKVLPDQYFNRVENMTETAAAYGLPKWIVSNLMRDTGKRYQAKEGGNYAGGKLMEYFSSAEMKSIIKRQLEKAPQQKKKTILDNLLNLTGSIVSNQATRQSQELTPNEIAILRDAQNPRLASKAIRKLEISLKTIKEKFGKNSTKYIVVANTLDDAREMVEVNKEYETVDFKYSVKEGRKNFKEFTGIYKLIEGESFTPNRQYVAPKNILAYEGRSFSGIIKDFEKAKATEKDVEVSKKYENEINEVRELWKSIDPSVMPSTFSTVQNKSGKANEVINKVNSMSPEVFDAYSKTTEGKAELNEVYKNNKEIDKLYQANAATLDLTYKIMKESLGENQAKHALMFYKTKATSGFKGIRFLSGMEAVQVGGQGKQYFEHIDPRANTVDDLYKSIIDGSYTKQIGEKQALKFKGGYGEELAYHVMDAIHGKTSKAGFGRYLGNPELMNNTYLIRKGGEVVRLSEYVKELKDTPYFKRYNQFKESLDKTANEFDIATEGKSDAEIVDAIQKESAIIEKASKKIQTVEEKQNQDAFRELIKARATDLKIPTQLGVSDFRKTVDDATARAAGKDKKGTWFVPYTNEDFAGLMYPLYGKGKKGEADQAFIKKALLDPFNEAEYRITLERSIIANKMNDLNKRFKVLNKSLFKDLRKPISKGDIFNQQHAARVYIWSKLGYEIPDLKEANRKRLVDFVENNENLKAYAEDIITINDGAYPEPVKYWEQGAMDFDFIKQFSGTKRKEHLAQWQANVDMFFNKDNMNRLQVLYGDNYVRSLKGSLAAMKRGSNRVSSGDKEFNSVLDYINNSVGAVMFLNTKSAVLQSLSAINYINFKDNNPLAIAKTLKDPKAFTKQFNELWNSDYLLSRRDGLKINVSEAEVAQMLQGGTGNWFNTITAKAIKAGFTPTRLMDSFAIAFGGTSFYINRTNKYIKEGMTPEKAKDQATKDWIAISEESQQSSRTDRISSQQRGDLGRLVLAFANTPIQYNRLMKKALWDLKDGRGSKGTNISKALYYGALQNIIFSTLQQGLFSTMFNGDSSDDPYDISADDDKDTMNAAIKATNGTMDSFLRGLGSRGAGIAVLKNMALKAYSESQSDRPEYSKVALEALSYSPPIDSKITKLRQAADVFTYDVKSWDDFLAPIESFDDPRIYAGLKIAAATTNVGVDRAMVFNSQIKNAMNDELTDIQRIASILGWQGYELGIDDGELDVRFKKKKGLFDLDLDLDMKLNSLDLD